MTLRIGWFSTGAGPGSQRQRLLNAAVEKINDGTLDAVIAFVFCNRERGENEGTDSYLDLVERLDIPLITRSSRDFRRERNGALSKPGEPLPEWRREYDRAVAGLLAGKAFDVGVLAGYMLIFTADMCDRHPLLNLHPAAPGGPAGTWQEVIWQLIDQRANQSGVMMHLSTQELDAGPVVARCSFSLRDSKIDALWQAESGRNATAIRKTEGEESMLFREIRRRGAVREEPLMLATLRALAEERVRIEDRRVIDAHGEALGEGLDLTVEVDRAVLNQV
jgi:folate-dependent phosphoribosylglycinamide formyltransferase PurN